METISAQPFEQLPLARADIIAATAGQYRVYSDRKSFTLVEADSAVHALEASGLLAAFKIEREAMYKNTLIFPNFLPNASAPTNSVPPPEAPVIN